MVRKHPLTCSDRSLVPLRGRSLPLPMTASVNGTQIGHDTLASMAFSWGEMIAYASRGTWVMPGSVLGSGTCGGG